MLLLLEDAKEDIGAKQKKTQTKRKRQTMSKIQIRKIKDSDSSRMV